MFLLADFHHCAPPDRHTFFFFFSLKVHKKTFLAQRWDIDKVFVYLFFFFLKSWTSKAFFPAPAVFIPVECSPSMDCITSDWAGFMTQSRVSFILRAGWSTQKDVFSHRALSPILEAAETWWRATSPGKPFSGVSEKGPFKSHCKVPYVLTIHIHLIPLPHYTPSGTSLCLLSRSCALPYRCTGVSPLVCV